MTVTALKLLVVLAIAAGVFYWLATTSSTTNQNGPCSQDITQCLGER